MCNSLKNRVYATLVVYEGKKGAKSTFPLKLKCCFRRSIAEDVVTLLA